MGGCGGGGIQWREGYYFLTTSTLGRRRILANAEVAGVIFETFEWLESPRANSVDMCCGDV